MSRMNHVNTKEEVVEAFRVFDKDGQGYITANEFRTILNDLGEFMDANEIEDLIYEADTQGDGNIYYENFAEQLFAWD
eukprot:CAMPEP_0206204116 /NCGR_PEP_ID=MMETSP0166-20121206/13303_1 /ASSEMBLY_ACC=CAM_ASM_000260 /TAXON_ID=95228 /ORGANISM="Vannella robusta, Strain DIVA3 518/3/11/1/6" /LENGTH=77 /DNA_ID=CAMNT_0053623623 /DNA_START=18 /DNA_END=251 /DNA_ORIENTATION=+